MARLIQIQIHILFDSPLMDFENAGEGKSEVQVESYSH